MIILTLNPGSTSTKISLFSCVYLSEVGPKSNKEIKKIFHEEIRGSFQSIAEKIAENNFNFKEIDKFAVRIVHGGSYFTQPTKINFETLNKIREISELAPLHNPPAIKIIEEILTKKSDAQIWAIFDTAFHSTIPKKYSTYGIPREISRDLEIRKYGFHGTANQSAIRIVEEKTGKKIPVKTIICHLGGGASITAVHNGKSIGNSMGFTPLEGLVMVSRSGDIDPEIVPFLMKKLNLSADKVIEILNKKSGILGLTGTNNLAEVFENTAKISDYDLAFEIYIARVEKYLWPYISRLEGIDCLIFSGGTGEKNTKVHEKIIEKLNKLGFKPDIQILKVSEDQEMMRQIINL